MTRTENDLRDALRDLDRRAVEHGAPSTESILTQANEARLGRHRTSDARRLPRWLPPLAAAAVVAAAAATVAIISNDRTDSPAAGRPTSAHTSARPSSNPASSPTASPSSSPASSPASTATSSPASTSAGNSQPFAAATVLQDAAAKLDGTPWKTPAAQDFFYVRTTVVTTWTSVSGMKPGKGQSTDGTAVTVPGCRHGHLVADGESGSCTLNDVPHYLSDAPTSPAAWDAYLEHMAPGAKAGGAQGKIIVQVLHQDLTAPKAAAALLRYTATCPGLHTVAVRPVTGEKLVGVTCTSMSAGSYGLTFDASSHALVGFVPVSAGGQQDASAEIVRKTGIVPAIGRTP